jgi:LmbE family N-acetylglucosaminyl deacetylase
MTEDLGTPERVLAIGAHPDDVEFGCGATLAKWADAGCDVHLLVLTDGSKGSWEPGADLEALVAVRENEQRDAARELGAVDVTFLGAPDGELDQRLAYRAAVCEVIRRTRPDVVAAHDPWKRYRLHPDHRHAGFLALDGIVAARDPLFFPEQALEPHRPTHLLLFEADAPDHAEQVGDHLERKIDALLRHVSQWRSTMSIEADAPNAEKQRELFADRIRSEAADAAATLLVDAPAEIFKRLDDL